MSVRDHICCDGLVQPVWEREGLPFSVGRTQRIVPERTRRIVERRDRGCRVPGCANDRFLEVHHIIHWLNGGVTDTWNLICLCPHHHRLHHTGVLGISGNADDPDSIVFTDSRGSPLGSCGQTETPGQRSPISRPAVPAPAEGPRRLSLARPRLGPPRRTTPTPHPPQLELESKLARPPCERPHRWGPAVPGDVTDLRC